MSNYIYDDNSVQKINSNINNIGGNIRSGNSVLILISPKNIQDHFKRPYEYNFNNEVIEGVAEQIVNNPISGNSVKVALNSIPSLNHSIIPSAQHGFQLNTSAYSHLWSFILIIDENNDSLIQSHNNILNRKMYIGLCADEPISNFGLNSATPEQFVNPKCQLVITKQLQLTKYNTFGVNQSVPRTTTTVSNNIVHFSDEVWNNNSGKLYFTMEPHNIHKRAFSGNDGQYTIEDNSNALNVSKSVKLNSSLESPRKCIGDILSAIESGSLTKAYSSTLGEFSESSPIDDKFGDDVNTFSDYVGSAFTESQYLDRNKSSMMSDMSVNYLSMDMIQLSFNPKIVTLLPPQQDNFDIIPQHYNCINNIFASVVCSVIPSYLSNTNISAVGFMYNSYQDAMMVKHIEAASTVDQTMLQNAWRSFEYLLRNDLFPILFHNGGHFDLQVMAIINGSINVVLNFLDYELLPNNTVYQESSLLGGITSSIVGDSTIVDNNAIQLNDLIRAVGSQAIYH